MFHIITEMYIQLRVAVWGTISYRQRGAGRVGGLRWVLRSRFVGRSHSYPITKRLPESTSLLWPTTLNLLYTVCLAVQCIVFHKLLCFLFDKISPSAHFTEVINSAPLWRHDHLFLISRTTWTPSANCWFERNLSNAKLKKSIYLTFSSE